MDNNLTESSKDLMRLIQLKFSRLSKGQKLIAEYILKNYDKESLIDYCKSFDVFKLAYECFDADYKVTENNSNISGG